MYIYIIMNAKRRNYRKRATKKSTRKTSRRPGVSKSVRTYVKKTIHRMAENKTIGSQLALAGNPTNASSNGWVTNNVYPLAFNDTTMICTQNNSQSGRIGNKVNVRKAVVSYILTPASYNATTNTEPKPIDVRVVIFSLKQEPVIGINGSISQFGSFYQNGSGSAGFANNLSDQQQAINRDNFCVYYDKKVKLGYSSMPGTGTNTAYQQFNNNDYKLNVMRKIDVTKYLSKTYGWNDSANRPHSGKQVYICFIPSSAVGTNIGATQQLFGIWYDMKIDYEDI